MEFPANLRATLVEVVTEARGCYGDQDYPFNEIERRDAANVISALHSLGHEVSLADAAAVWETYSRGLQAGWLMGAETVEGALQGVVKLCEDIQSGSQMGY